MTISKQELEEFKSLWKKSYGCEIDDDEAYEEASRILNLIKAVYLPDLA